MLQIGDLVELQTLHDAKAIAQRRGQRARTGGSTDQRKGRQIDFNRARRRAFANHDIQLVIFHSRIEHLFHDRRQTMDLIDKQHVVRLKVGQHRGEIPGLLQHRARGGAQINAHLVGDNVGQRRFTQARRAEDQQMIERITTQLCRLDKNLHLRAHLRLANVFVEQLRTDRAIDDLFLGNAAC